MGSYVLYGAAASLINAWPDPTVFDQVFEDDKEIPWHEILWATSFGAVLSFLAAYCFTYKAVLRFGRRVRVTRRFGDEDVWTYFQELSGVEWVFVRDHKQDLVYYGWIQAYSDPGESREMLLRDVDVYDNTGEGNLLYSTPVLYLARAEGDLSIEAADSDSMKGNDHGRQREILSRQGEKGRDKSETADSETSDATKATKAQSESEQEVIHDARVVRVMSGKQS